MSSENGFDIYTFLWEEIPGRGYLIFRDGTFEMRKKGLAGVAASFRAVIEDQVSYNKPWRGFPATLEDCLKELGAYGKVHVKHSRMTHHVMFASNGADFDFDVYHIILEAESPADRKLMENGFERYVYRDQTFKIDFITWETQRGLTRFLRGAGVRLKEYTPPWFEPGTMINAKPSTKRMTEEMGRFLGY